MSRYNALILHAHVPWVRHPELPRCLEEDWLFEVILEAYLPQLEVLHRLRREGVKYQITMNLSPTLITMLRDELMQERTIAYIERASKLAVSEGERVDDPAYKNLTHWYAERLEGLRQMYEEEWDRDLVEAFADLQRSGHLEITTCCATHGLLPLLMKVPEAAKSQLQEGVNLYKKSFGTNPVGLWLPECAFAPALSEHISDAGLNWTMIEEHGLTSSPHANPAFPYLPARTPENLFIFGRDIESSRQVWSAESGYPGDPRYREFYRDVGLEAPAEALENYLEGSDIRRFTGLKLHRVTGPTEDKQLYDPAEAARATDDHAVHFVSSRAAQLATIESRGVENPIVVSAFDAELFGHWWFEGPQFLEKVLRLGAEREDFEFTTPTAYLNKVPFDSVPTGEPVSSSWGEGGYFETWLSEENAWIYPHLHQRAEQLTRAAQVLTENESSMPSKHFKYRHRCLQQMGRELMIAQSSDWAFLMRNGSSRPYARKQTEDRIERFDELASLFARTDLEAKERVESLEAETPLFPDFSLEIFSTK